MPSPVATATGPRPTTPTECPTVCQAEARGVTAGAADDAHSMATGQRHGRLTRSMPRPRCVVLRAVVGGVAPRRRDRCHAGLGQPIAGSAEVDDLAAEEAADAVLTRGVADR